MEKDSLQHLFNNLKDDFNLESPTSNHEQRFLDKLNADNAVIHGSRKVNNTFWWKPMVGVAAALVLIFTIVIGSPQSNTDNDLASVSPEMAKTQDFFVSTIEFELNKLKSETSPETQLLIQDAMLQLGKLESKYDLLKEDLTNSGYDSRVVYAMISNFQNRIDVLQNTLKQIENINQLKNINSYENSTTL